MFAKTKKFRITDSDGQAFEVEEVNDEEAVVIEPAPTESEVHDDIALTEDEIKALKSLASVADKLIDLAKFQLTTANEDPKEVEDEEVEDSDEESKDCEALDSEEDEERVLKTDSKKSFGSLQQRLKDSFINAEEEKQIDIAAAWANRGKGGNR